MFDMIPFVPKSFARGFEPFRDVFGPPMRAGAVDIREKDGNILVDIDLPGFSKDDISVSFRDDVLRVHAEHKNVEESNDGYVRRERSWASVDRSFSFPGVNADAISAKFTDGVLALELPKVEAPEEEVKQIAIA